MSKDLGYKQVKNVESRRTWDRDYYEAKAKERIEKGDDYEDKEDGPSRRSAKEEFQPATMGAAGPAGSARAYLKVRPQHCVHALHSASLVEISVSELSTVYLVCFVRSPPVLLARLSALHLVSCFAAFSSSDREGLH